MLSKTGCWLLGAVLSLAFTQSLAAQEVKVLTHPTVTKAVAFTVTPALRDLIKEHPQELPFGYRQGEPMEYPKLRKLMRSGAAGNSDFRDPVAQTRDVPDTVPVKLLDWLGLGQGFPGYQVYIGTSDMNLAIGDSEIIQWGNNNFAVFDLSGNNLLFDGQSFVRGNILFAGLPNCGVRNDGDEIAQWDKIAHRWVMEEPVMLNPARDCIAISQTPDALGPWYAYEFAVPNADTYLSDYGKLAVWPDAYYASHNQSLDNVFAGTTPCAYERTKMLAGDPAAQQVCFVDYANGDYVESFDDNQLPSDLDSATTLPPSGMPNVYMGSIDNSQTGIETNVYYYKFHVDWNNPQNSTFSCVGGTCAIPVAPFHDGGWIGYAPEPGGYTLRPLANRLMYRLAYRADPSPTISRTIRTLPMQHWVVSHAVNNNGSLGVRWYEFRAPVGSSDPVVYQQGTFAPDSSWRFMSSIAMDKMGNIAMSYTVTNADSIYPSIAYTGRAKSDPLGTMGPEQILVSGTGSETDTSNLWGDYYDMALSNDGCTFVTTGQYYVANASYAWSTHVGKLKFANCNP
jgi:hypothetical protein